MENLINYLGDKVFIPDSSSETIYKKIYSTNKDKREK